MYIAMLCLCQASFLAQDPRLKTTSGRTDSIIQSAAVEGEAMPLLDRSARWAANRLPKVISPKTHAVLDYAAVASFFGMAAFFWRRNQRAAVSCLFCGAAESVAVLLTDYSGSAARPVNFESHGAIDLGLTGLVLSVPDIMRFSKEPEARFFRTQGLAMAVVTGLTDFTGTGERRRMERVAKRAA
jgi:hypothetical protein